MTVTFIVHGCVWPDGSVIDALEDLLRAVEPTAEIVDAIEDARVPRGAASAINAAAARSRGDRLVVLEPWTPLTRDQIAGLVAEAGEALVTIGHAGDVVCGVPTHRRPSLDLIETLGAGDAGLDRVLATAASAPIPAWGLPRDAFDEVGGLDERLWSVGVLADLAARLEGRLPHVCRTFEGASPARRQAWPLRSQVADLLSIRNRLITAFRCRPAGELGVDLARLAVLELRKAWVASGLRREDFQFGGQWGRGEGAFSRALRPGAHGAAQLTSRAQVLLPLLALDSFLDQVPELLEERRRIVGGRVEGAGVLADEVEPRVADGTAPDATDAYPDGIDSSAGTKGPGFEGVSAHPGAKAPGRQEVEVPGPGFGTVSAYPGAEAPGLRGDREATPWVDPALEPPSLVAPGLQPRGRLTNSNLPRVSVIVVSWNGREHLPPCMTSLLASDYPADRLEIVCVDNGSTDGSVELLRGDFPRVRVVALGENRGFTGGNTAGVDAATGEVLVFLNNDMRVEPDALRHLVAAIDGGTACVAARVLSWDGRYIDFVRGTVNFEARGFQDFYGQPAGDPGAASAETFFPNGGAFAVTSDAYTRAGGFDDEFFAYYDDVDLGWRLRLIGTRIGVEERAIVYHRHGATSRAQPEGQKRFLMERNALITVMKNYGEQALRLTLGPTLLLAVRRVLDQSRLDPHARGAAALAPFSSRLSSAEVRTSDVYVLDDQHRPVSVSDEVVLGLPAEALGALGCAVEALPRVQAARAAIQVNRRTSDRDILPHFGRTFEAISPFASYQAIQEALVEALDLPALFRARTRVLIISHEALAANMSGPAVRFLELGRALADTVGVTVAGPGAPSLRDDRCTIAGYDPAKPESLRRLAEEADVLFVQGFTLAQYPFLTELMVPIVVDLYCPFTIEHLEQNRAALHAREAPSDDVVRQAAEILGVQNAQLETGDFFVCASETQRDFWIGNLHSCGRINPRTYADDPRLRRLIDVVPFGLPGEDIARWRGQPPVLKGVRPGIGRHDTLLLWGGSLLDWQDPLTLIDAVALLVGGRPDVKLFFMGTKHPNPLVAPMRVVEASRERARVLGLLDTHVFFNDWVPYTERARYLLEADLGLSTHREHLETHFSFRTRMLDYVWAGLPIVCTRGDVFAKLVEERGLGLTVAPGDASALAAAIRALLDEPERRSSATAALHALARELEWRSVVVPLARFCAEPRYAADRASRVAGIRKNLANKYRLTKWLKRTALRAGLSELRIEQVKRLGPVRALMAARNRLALKRATK